MLENEISCNLITNTKENPMGPIEKYNFFINLYNQEPNSINNTTLKSMKNKKLYNIFINVLKKYWGKFLYTILLIFPMLNIFIYLSSIFLFIVYQRSYRIYKENYEKIKDPFKNMIFSPEICEILGENYYFYQIEFKGFYLH